MTSDAALASPGTRTSNASGRTMRFTVDGWDPSYGASLDLEDYLEESTANVQVDLELPASRWHAIDVRADRSMPGAMLFVDGVRRIEAHAWIDDDSRGAGRATQATAALCASYAAGVVCCFGQQAHLVTAEVRRGLFSIAPHASDIVTRAGLYQAHHVAAVTAGVPLISTGHCADASTCRVPLGTSSPIAAPTCRRSSTRWWARSHRDSAPLYSSWARPGTGTAGTCGCRAPRVPRGREWCASNAPRTCPSPR